MNGSYIKTWHHVAISVLDIQAMKAFFCDTLGFKVDWEHENRSGVTMDQVVGLQGVDAHVVMLKGYGTRIELFRYRSPRGKNRGPMQQCDPGLIHICLQVNDINSMYEELIRQNISFNCPPRNLRLGVWATYMKGPENLTIELVQYDEPQ